MVTNLDKSEYNLTEGFLYDNSGYTCDSIYKWCKCYEWAIQYTEYYCKPEESWIEDGLDENYVGESGVKS